MGMFDWLKCDYPLPEIPPAFVMQDDHQFQTKDLDCLYHTYEITATGKLLQEDGQRVQGIFTVDFYSSNVRGVYGKYHFTKNGEDWESVEYRAEFVNGRLQSITETGRESGKAVPLAAMRQHESVEIEIDTSEPAIGAKMYMLWGGQAEGYPVTLVVKTDRRWAVTTESGEIEVRNPTDLGNVLFHSSQDAERMRAARDEAQKREFEYYESLLS